MWWIAAQPEPDAARADAMPQGEAGALVDSDAPVPADPLQALGWMAMRLTPRVAVQPPAVLLEISQCLRLWRGLPGVRAELARSSPWPLRWAQGPTGRVAWARLQVAPQPLDAAAAADTAEPASIDALPLCTLPEAAAHAPSLAALGVLTWGQLRALPRDGVVRRWRAGLLEALDQAYGRRPERWTWLTLPPVFDAQLALPSPVHDATALLFAARRLLAQLRVWLLARQQGVLALVLIGHCDTRRDGPTHDTLKLRSAQPTQDMAHLQRLLAEHLAHHRLAAPVHTLQLRTQCCTAFAPAVADWLDAPVAGVQPWLPTLERLSARLGPGGVRVLQPRPDHRPEQAQDWISAIENVAFHAYSESARGKKSIQKNGDAWPPDWPQDWAPTALIDPPLPLRVRQQQPCYPEPLTLVQGPYRLETGWWQDGGAARRDYFVAYGAQAGWLWVFQTLPQSGALADPAAAAAPAGQWYLHGVFA
ncbi:MAG: DNA polymerase Y family protein [Rhodoferax sp.]